MINQLFTLWEEMTLNKKILVITGSGIFSSHSFIVHELTKINQYNHKSLLTKENLSNSPDKIWDIILSHRLHINQYQPNKAHEALVKLEHFFQDNFSLITENIEGFHLRAGNYRVIELNGNIWKNKILSNNISPLINRNKIPQNKNQQLLRPDIILLNEEIERKKILQSRLLIEQSDLILMIGVENRYVSSSINEMIEEAYLSHTKIIEINETQQHFNKTNLYIHIEAEKILPLLISLIIDLEKGIRKYREV